MLVASGGSTDWSRIDRQRAAAELARIESVLARAVPAERLPDDPLVVELGETVTIRLADDVMESYVIVDPSEVLVSGEQWVSSRSPLGRALLGRRVGDEVDVAAPGGVYRCIIDGATRP